MLRAATRHTPRLLRRLDLRRATFASGGGGGSGGGSSSSTDEVPIIDLGPLRRGETGGVVQQVANACADWGFFQVVNTDVDTDVIARFEEQMRVFFALPMETKRAMRRGADNARGFFDDELTKQRRDWKQGLDFGATPVRDWSLPDEHPAHANLDGFNRFPPAELAPRFRPAMTDYFVALTELSERLSRVMAVGLEMPADYFADALRQRHTSFLRLNYYPPCTEPGPPPPLGISPHKDAGFLTVLAQDPDCHSLQVRRRADGEWVTVHPVPGAFTINTGDMAQIWSNDRYHAPEHRVLTHPTKERFSAPFFYNPGFDTAVAPLPSLGTPRYNECVWGYFRAQRFAGDYADYGTEIQISDFAHGSGSWHVANQARFLQRADFARPFDVETNRELLSPTAS